jgi:hypothetical protein
MDFSMLAHYVDLSSVGSNDKKRHQVANSGITNIIVFHTK